LPPAARHVRALDAARPRAGDVLPLPRRAGGSVRLRAHRAHDRGLPELPRAARQPVSSSAALSAGRAALLPVPRGDAGEQRAAELPRLRALPHSHPRFRQPADVPGAVMRRCGGWVVVVLVVLGALRALAEEAPPAEAPATTEPAAPSAPLLPYHLTG